MCVVKPAAAGQNEYISHMLLSRQKDLSSLRKLSVRGTYLQLSGLNACIRCALLPVHVALQPCACTQTPAHDAPHHPAHAPHHRTALSLGTPRQSGRRSRRSPQPSARAAASPRMAPHPSGAVHEGDLPCKRFVASAKCWHGGRASVHRQRTRCAPWQSCWHSLGPSRSGMWGCALLRQQRDAGARGMRSSHVCTKMSARGICLQGSLFDIWSICTVPRVSASLVSTYTLSAAMLSCDSCSIAVAAKRLSALYCTPVP